MKSGARLVCLGLDEESNDWDMNPVITTLGHPYPRKTLMLNYPGYFNHSSFEINKDLFSWRHLVEVFTRISFTNSSPISIENIILLVAWRKECPFKEINSLISSSPITIKQISEEETKKLIKDIIIAVNDNQNLETLLEEVRQIFRYQKATTKHMRLFLISLSDLEILKKSKLVFKMLIDLYLLEDLSIDLKKVIISSLLDGAREDTRFFSSAI